mgnify:CR=1 FL=1
MNSVHTLISAVGRKALSGLMLLLSCWTTTLASAQALDEYGWRKSDTKVVGYYSGGSKSETLTSQASDPKSEFSFTIGYNYSIVGVDMEEVKREVKGSHYWSSKSNTVGFRGKVRKGSQVRFRMSMNGGSGTLSPKYYAYRITFTPYKIKCYELGGEYKEELTPINREQVIKETPLTQTPVLDTVFTPRDEGMYMFVMSGGGMWDGSKKTGKPLQYYPGVPAFNVVVYLLVDGNSLASSTTEDVVVPEPKASPVDDNVGPHYEEDNDAWGFDGIWPFAIPASVIAAVLGYGLTRRKKDDGDDEPSPAQGRCEMVIYKDFGDTLLVGDSPRQVYAKIVRKTQHGDVDDPALTALISITSADGYMMVGDGGMQGPWRTAWLGAPETGNEPDEGIVAFRMGNEGGSYTNRIHFRIEAGEVIFGQPNLTLPAHYEKEVRLPFVVTGIDDASLVAANITDLSGQATANYSVEVEWNEKERLYYAVIHDRVLDKEKDKGVPGKYLSYRLNIEAHCRSGRSITGSLDMYRYYMGLVLEIYGGNDVKCFIEEYDVAKHRTKKFAAESGGKWYVPAETKCKLTLFDYDETEHCILQLAPLPKDFKVKADDEGKQYLADKAFVQFDVTSCKPGDGTYGVLRCTKAVLDAPNRVAGTAVLNVMQGEKTLTLEQPVRLCSQPRRDFGSDMHMMAAAHKDDEHITDRLFHIRSEIYRNKLVDNLFPLLKYIDMVLDGYDPDFGYDKNTLNTITRTYNDVFTGVKAGANAEAPKPLTLADDMLLFITSWYETAKTTSQDLGLCGRLFLGFATLGCSEIVFGTVDTISIGEEIYTGMKDYVDKGGDSAWGGFYVGAKVAVREYIMSKVMEKGMKTIGTTAKAAGLTPEKMKEALGKINTKLKNPFSTTTKGAPIKAAGQRTTIAKANAKARVQAGIGGKPAISGTSGKPSISGTSGKSGKPVMSVASGKADLSEARNLGRKRAQQNVNDLRSACEMYRSNPTPENKALRDKLILKCQGDKQTMYLLKEKGDTFTSTRRDFNNHLDDIYRNTDQKVKEELSRKLGGKEVRTKNISSKTRTDLKEGKTVTMDRDSTYQYLDDDGVWKTIDDKTFGEGTEKMVEQTYNRHFHEQSTGIKPKTEPGVDLKPLEQKLADKHARNMDQMVIQNELTNPESYGRDVDMMLDKSRHGEHMQDAHQVGKAVENKGTERFETARKMLDEADTMTDPVQKLNKQADAVGEMMEGCRQETKIMDQFTDSMDIARSGENGGNLISDKLRDGIEIMRMCSEGTLPVEQAEANLRLIGYDSFEAVCRDHAATITTIGS